MYYKNDDGSSEVDEQKCRDVISELYNEYNEGIIECSDTSSKKD